MAEGIIIFALWYIALAYHYCKENFCKDDTNEKEELPKEQESDTSELDAAEPYDPPELPPTKENDFEIQPIPYEKEKDLPEASPTVEDLVSEVKEVAAEIKENFDNEEED